MENPKEERTEKIRAFIDKWFEHFDRLDGNSFFTQYLSEDVKMKLPGNDLFSGHEGFNNWFTASKNVLIANTSHDVSDIKITETSDNQFDVAFKVRYTAEMKDNKIDMDAREDWKLSWNDAQDQPVISEYIVS